MPKAPPMKLTATVVEPPPPVEVGLGVWAARLWGEPKPKGNSKTIMPVGERCSKCKQAPQRVLRPRREDEQAERTFSLLLRSAAPPVPFERDVLVSTTFVLPIRASWSKAKKAAALAGTCRPSSRKGSAGSIPDLGNLEKLIDDVLEKGGWIVNDSQIVERGRSRKIYGTEPGYLIVLSELPTWSS